MSACAAPPPALSPDQRHDIAYRRAQGASWEEVGTAMGFDPAQLRRVVQRDPDFAAAFEGAWDETVREAEALAMRRLRRLAESDDPKVSLRAAEALMQCVRAYRRAVAESWPVAPRGLAPVEAEARPTASHKPEPRAVVMG